MHSLGSGDPPTKIPDVVSLDLSYDEITDGEAIGQGGNADVFRVTVERGGRETPVAVKQPRLQGTLDTDTVDQFVQEADVWAELDGHEHIVSLYDWGAEPLPWLAMEYMNQGTLADVPDGERLPLEQALWVGVCVCRAVHHAHRFGVAHHDIKPANVLLTSTDDGWAAPKVSDWGLARLMLDETGSVAEFSPGYAAPEQFDAEEYGSPDDRTDIYQVGTLVYELVTGHPPFEGSATTVMQGVLSTEPTPPSEAADVPTELDEVLGEALAKEPDERYDTIVYLRDKLRELLDTRVNNRSVPTSVPDDDQSVTEDVTSPPRDEDSTEDPEARTQATGTTRNDPPVESGTESTQPDTGAMTGGGQSQSTLEPVQNWLVQVTRVAENRAMSQSTLDPVQDWLSTGPGDSTSRQRTLLTLLSFVAYPLLVCAAVFPVFGSPVRLPFALLLVPLVSALVVRPRRGIAVFGSWALLFPVVFAQLGVPVLAPSGLLTMSTVLVSLCLAVLSWLILWGARTGP